jgi:hypothetical protein
MYTFNLQNKNKKNLRFIKHLEMFMELVTFKKYQAKIN